jgi:fibro-slime domain-containing protein
MHSDLLSAAARHRRPVTFLIVFTAASAAPAQAPDLIELRGVIRDFRSAHVDFNVEPIDGFGHYAGNIGLTLSADETPVLVGGGFKVGQEWRNADGQPIAPHLYGSSADTGGSMPNIMADGRIRARNTSAIDSYDSTIGPYGGGNVGSEAVAATNSVLMGQFVIDNSSTMNGDVLIGPGGDPAVVVDDQGGDGITGTIGHLPATIPMPVINVPTGLPVYPGGALDVPINGSMTLTGNWQVTEFHLRRKATVTVNGDVTIVCDDRWRVERDAQVIVPDGSSLTVYCRTQCRLYGPDSAINPDTSDPSKVTIYILGSDPWNDQFVANGSGTMACARLYAPTNLMDLDQSAQFFGTFLGLQIEMNNQSRLHVDTRSYGGSCLAVNDMAGMPEVSGDGGITSAASFAEWYDDVLGVNLSMAHTITLIADATGVYEYLDDAFYPADGRLLGNEDEAHNSFFTYAISAKFSYETCAGQFFEFEGADDAWLFVDGNLVMDLAGVLPGSEQFVEMDRLGLLDGEVHEVHFFFANRQASSSRFNVRTNIAFWSDDVGLVASWPFD